MWTSAEVRVTIGLDPVLATRLGISRVAFMSESFLPFAMPADANPPVAALPADLIGEKYFVVRF
jgi:hypothetical protein